MSKCSTHDDNIELIINAQRGDKQSLNKVVENNFNLVHSVSKRYSNKEYEYEDIFQIGCMGLVKAIHNFDTSYNVQFSTYAVPKIEGEIKRFFRDDGIVKVNRETKVLGRRLLIKKSELEHRLNREITYEELSEYTGNTIEDVINALKSMSLPRSLSEVIYSDDGTDIILQDQLASKFDLEEEVLRNLEILNLRKCISLLPDRQRKVMELRMQEKTQVDISKELKISQAEVSRSEKKAFEKLKELLVGQSKISQLDSLVVTKNKFEIIIKELQELKEAM